LREEPFASIEATPFFPRPGPGLPEIAGDLGLVERAGGELLRIITHKKPYGIPWAPCKLMLGKCADG